MKYHNRFISDIIRKTIIASNIIGNKRLYPNSTNMWFLLLLLLLVTKNPG